MIDHRDINSINNFIKRNQELLSVPNRDTGKPCDFIVSIRVSNDGEVLNLYVDYKTSSRWINRLIFALAMVGDFTPDEINNLEKHAAEQLRLAGHSANVDRG